MDYWLTSDFHYHHKNLVKGVSNWEKTSGCRDFSDIPTHNKTIVDNINKYVKENDVMYFLGDWSFGGVDKIWKFRKQLNCKNIHLCYGNHDHHLRKNKTLIVPAKDKGRALELHIPYTDRNDKILIKAQSLFQSTQFVKYVKIHGHTIFLSHYAHRVWDKSHKGRWHCYGHSHSSIAEYGKSMDVGLDSAYKYFGEYRPFKFQEIQKIMSNKEIETPDHHE